MAIAKAPLCPRLLSWSLGASLCHAYSTAPPTATASRRANTNIKPNTSQRASRSEGGSNTSPKQARERAPQEGRPRRSPALTTTGTSSEKNRKYNGANTDTKKRSGPPMFVPALAKKFIRNGHLQTTPDVWEFLQSTGIEYDNSKTKLLSLGPGHIPITETFACKVTYSTSHIMHPFHLQYLAPNGHPLIEGIKAKYRAKKETQPLWAYFIGRNEQTNLVRSIAHGRMAYEFWTALNKLEEKEDPERRATGTVMVTVYDSKKAASSPAVQFGKVLAEAVVREHRNRPKSRNRGDGEDEAAGEVRKRNPRKGSQNW
ncbi:hypothetical protein QQZ08_006714 [Neonectria magnoliae]|uniref:Uncharacterized protein n=1 Tax=Neonectria magnoliae TaxID=2732573 RepID=A0ABR1I1K4_9HYPO